MKILRSLPHMLMLWLITAETSWAAELPTVSIRTVLGEAAERGSRPAVFVLSRTGDLSNSLDVSILYSGSAQSYHDYLGMNNLIRFKVGEDTAVVALTPVADNIAEPLETITVTVAPLYTYDYVDAPIAETRLFQNQLYQIGTNHSATARLEDDPEAATRKISLSIGPKQLTTVEGSDKPASFILRRFGPSERGMAVAYDVISRRVEMRFNESGGGGGSSELTYAQAVGGVDFKPVPNVFNFGPGQTELVVPVTALPDSIAEGWEHFTVRLRRSVEYAIDGTDIATVFIGDPATQTNRPPSTALINPIAGDVLVVTDRSLLMRGVASDSDGRIARVEFLVDGRSVAISTDPAVPGSFYEGRWSAATDGFHDLAIRATDNQGGTTTTQPIRVQLISPNQPPSISTRVTGIAPVSTSGREYRVTAPYDLRVQMEVVDPDLDAIRRVELWVDGRMVGSRENPKEEILEIVAEDLAYGAHDLFVKAVDSRGAVSFGQFADGGRIVLVPQSSAELPRSIGFGQSMNQVIHESALTNEIVFTSSADPTPLFQSVRILLNGEPALELPPKAVPGRSQDTWRIPFTLKNLANGSHVIQAQVTGRDGQLIQSRPYSVIIATPIQIVTARITSPAEGTSFTAGTRIQIHAEVSTLSLNGTTAFIDSVLFKVRPVGKDEQVIDFSPRRPAMVNWTPSRPGNYELFVVATSSEGRTATSQPVRIEIIPATRPSPSPLPEATESTVGGRLGSLWFESWPTAVETDESGTTRVVFNGIPFSIYHVETLDESTSQWNILQTVESGTGQFEISEKAVESPHVYRARRLF